MVKVSKLFGILNLFNNIILACILSLRNVIDIMSTHFSLVQKIRTIDSYIICSTAYGKFVAHVDGIFNIINTCYTLFKILVCTLIKIGMMNPVFVIFRLYAMVLTYFFDLFKQSTIYRDISTFVGYLVNIWKMTTLTSIVSDFVSRDILHLVLFLHPRALLGLVMNSISEVVYLPFNLMLMAFKLSFKGSHKIAFNGLKMIYDKAMNGWERMILSSSICQKLERKAMEANRKLEKTERDLGSNLKEAERRAENETKRRRESSNHSTTQIQKVHERLAIVEEELRCKCVQIEDLESRLFEDKLNECWRGWEVKREEVVEEQNIFPYCK